MKRLIVPDVHQRWQKVEAIRWAFPDVPFIFLGDWFDTHTKSVAGIENCRETWRVLNNEASRDDTVLLLGNHDWHYTPFVSRNYICSGYQPVWATVLMNDYSPAVWNRFNVVHRIGTTIFSHAGFNDAELLDEVEYLQASFAHLADPKLRNICERVGSARGGMGRGGPLWLDFNCEFCGIDEIYQVVGHTIQYQIVEKDGKKEQVFYPREYEDEYSTGICIDSALNHVLLMTFDDETHALLEKEIIPVQELQ